MEDKAVKIRAEAYAKIRKAAKEEDRTMTAVISRAIDLYLRHRDKALGK